MRFHRRRHGYVESVTAGAGLEARVAIVGAPLAGGPSTPALAAAVSEAGGLGFLAAGYKTAAAVQAELHALRVADIGGRSASTSSTPTRDRVDEAALQAYVGAAAMRKSSGTAWWSASRAGRTTIGRPSSRSRRASDRMSFRSRSAARSVRSSSGSKDCGCRVWCTVTSVAEARAGDVHGRRCARGSGRRSRWPPGRVRGPRRGATSLARTAPRDRIGNRAAANRGRRHRGRTRHRSRARQPAPPPRRSVRPCSSRPKPAPRRRTGNVLKGDAEHAV